MTGRQKSFAGWIVVAWFGASAGCSLPASAGEVVWTGTQTVDRVVRFEHGQNLVLRPGTRVEFVGTGRIVVRDANFRATGAELVASTVLTNAYRVQVENGSLTMTGCTIRGLRTHEPVKGYCYFIGSLCGRIGGGRLADNTFVDSSPIAYVNASGVEVTRNVFVRPRAGGAYLFNSTDCRVADNAFFDSSAEALQLNGTYLTEVACNRFTDCEKGIRAAGIRKCRIVGNSFFGGSAGVDIWWDGPGNLYLANLFEGLSSQAVSGDEALGDGIVFANNLVVRCGNGFLIPAIPEGRQMTVRNNGFAFVGLALRLDGGALDALGNAVWKSKYGCQGRNGAKLTTPGLVKDDPRFVSSERCDWRLKDGSPWRRDEAAGGSVGFFW